MLESRKVCRICMKIESEDSVEEFKQIDIVIKEMLQLLLDIDKPSTEINEDSNICKNCEENTRNAFEFKTVCFETEELILSLDLNTLDMQTLYLVKNTDGDQEIKVINKKICRLCISLIGDGDFKYMDDIKLTAMKKCIKEVDFESIPDGVVCIFCFTCLTNYYHLMNTFSSVENKIYEYRVSRGGNKTGQVNLGKALEFTIRQKIEHQLEECRINVERMEWNDLREQYNIANLETFRDADKFPRKKNSKRGPNRNSNISYKLDKNGTKWYRCPACPYKSIRINDVYRHHHAKHKNNGKIFVRVQRRVLQTKCNLCMYKAFSERGMALHVEYHNLVDQKIIYNCGICGYLSDSQNRFDVHMRRHSDFKCSQCIYSTTCKESFAKHVSKHDNQTVGSNLRLRCQKCSYSSKCRSKFNKHLSLCNGVLTSQDFLYCANCSYRSLDKQLLILHIERMHRDPRLTKKFICEICGHTAKQRGNLDTHMLVHKNMSEVKVYKCGVCSLETKHVSAYRRHVMIHQPDSYFCYNCSYSSKTKVRMAGHMKKHQKRVNDKK